LHDALPIYHGIADQRGRLREHAALGFHHRRRLDGIVRGHGADDEGAAVLFDPREPGDFPQIDDVSRSRQAELHRRQQAVPAGQELGVVLVLAQQIERFLDRAGGVVVELGWIHARSPYFFARAAWMVVQTRSAVSGIVSMWSTPRPPRASTTALTTAGGAARRPGGPRRH